MKYNFLLSIKSKRNSFYTVLLLFQISIVRPLIELFIYTCFMHNSIICETDFFTYNHIYFSFLTSLADSGKCDVLRNIVTLSNLVYSFFSRMILKFTLVFKFTEKRTSVKRNIFYWCTNK